eukprot:Awhi_evm1s11207
MDRILIHSKSQESVRSSTSNDDDDGNGGNDNHTVNDRSNGNNNDEFSGANIHRVISCDSNSTSDDIYTTFSESISLTKNSANNNFYNEENDNNHNNSNNSSNGNNSNNSTNSYNGNSDHIKKNNEIYHVNNNTCSLDSLVQDVPPLGIPRRTRKLSQLLGIDANDEGFTIIKTPISCSSYLSSDNAGLSSASVPEIVVSKKNTDSTRKINSDNKNTSKHHKMRDGKNSGSKQKPVFLADEGVAEMKNVLITSLPTSDSLEVRLPSSCLLLDQNEQNIKIGDNDINGYSSDYDYHKITSDTADVNDDKAGFQDYDYHSYHGNSKLTKLLGIDDQKKNNNMKCKVKTLKFNN